MVGFAFVQSFEYTGLPFRVVFGLGSVQKLGAELELAGIRRPLLLCSHGGRKRAESWMSAAGLSLAGVFDGARMHVPVETRRAAGEAHAASGADGAIALGGGSTIGLAKVMAKDLACPYVAVPTTYSGSEMTPIWGLTEEGQKRTGRDPKVLPQAVIYDPELTLGFAPKVAGPSGINAIAHCVEALYGENANPATDAIAEKGIRLLGQALPQISSQPEDLEARGEALLGAWLAGLSLASVGMGLHHKICHVLGGAYDLDHARTHTIVLPHALHYNRHAAPEALSVVAAGLGEQDAPSALYQLARSVNAPLALRDIGLRENQLDEAAKLATGSAYANPAPVTQEGVRALLENAFHGRPPA